MGDTHNTEAHWSAQSCSVNGCSGKVRTKSSGLCTAHYMRKRRRGTVNSALEESPPPKEARHTSGYILEYLPEHPLWPETHGRLYQHRRVFYDQHGRGPFPCHWCKAVVSWESMHVDHVNAVRHDNRVANLVASCPACNRARGLDAMRATHRANGKLLTYNGETKCLAEWAKDLGIRYQSLTYRLNSGWSVADALTTKRGRTGPLQRKP